MTPRPGLAVICCLLLLAVACGSDDHAPILLVGVDGLDWKVILPLLAEGELPNLGRLVEEGSYGLLASMHPTFSPIIWTTMATGKTRKQHGIRGFIHRERGGLYTSLDRRTKAFWDILSEHRRRVAVVGWWITYPAEEVNGVMVAQVNTRKDSGRGIIKGDLFEGLEDQTFPPELAAECLEIHGRIGERLDEHTRQVFGEFRRPLQGTAASMWQHTQWAFLADATYAEIAARLAADGDYDLLAFYLGGADVVGHRFWRYMQPELYDHPPAGEEIEQLRRIIPDYYRWIDGAIGRVVAAMPADTTVMVVSDHGMRAINLGRRPEAERNPRRIRSGGHPRSLPGTIILSGPGVRRGPPLAAGSARYEELPVVASVYDVTPTLLAMLGLPVGADMRGQVRTEMLAELPEIQTVETHDSPEWLATRGEVDPALGDDPERIEQLRALGYIN